MTDKVSKEEIKKVEKLQKLEEQIKKMQEDYKHLIIDTLCYEDDRWNAERFNYNYEKDLKRIIKHRILKLKRKRKEMLKDDR